MGRGGAAAAGTELGVFGGGPTPSRGSRVGRTPGQGGRAGGAHRLFWPLVPHWRLAVVPLVPLSRTHTRCCSPPPHPTPPCPHPTPPACLPAGALLIQYACSKQLQSQAALAEEAEATSPLLLGRDGSPPSSPGAASFTQAAAARRPYRALTSKLFWAGVLLILLCLFLFGLTIYGIAAKA